MDWSRLACFVVADHTGCVFVFYLFLLAVAAVGGLIYVWLFYSHIPGATDERFGALEDVPDTVGQWIEDEEPSSEGEICERRTLQSEAGGKQRNEWILQVRYRDAKSREILRVEPEKKVKRRRVRS